LYSKPRSEFGKPCKFGNGETQVLESILPTKEYDENYVLQNPVVSSVNTTPFMSESDVNTDSVETNNASMSHKEGGWPKDVDFTEQSDVTRFRKKAEKDDSYLGALRTLVPIAERCMKQNHTVDIYEQFFEGPLVSHYSEPSSAKGLAILKDPSPVKRSVSSINWHPEINSSKIAVSYSIMNFQDKRLNEPGLSKSVGALDQILSFFIHSTLSYFDFCHCNHFNSHTYGMLQIQTNQYLSLFRHLYFVALDSTLRVQIF